MKELIKRSFLFLGILTIFLTIIWQSGDLLLQRTQDVFYAFWNEPRNLKAKTDILIFGNSRAAVHYNTVIIDSMMKTESYNLGMDGMTSIQQEYRYKYYRQFNDAPKIVIINVDDETYYHRKEIIHPQQYYPLLGDSLISGQCLRMGMSFLRVHVPQVKYFGASTCFEVMWHELTGVQGNKKHERKKGFLAIHKGWQEDLFQDIIKQKVFSKINRNLMLRHENFIKSLQNEGIKVILVFAPQYQPYTASITGHHGLMSYYKNLASRLNTDFWDYSGSPLCEDKQNFCEPHHMNYKASDRFTDDICRQLIYTYSLQFPKQFRYFRNTVLR